MVVMYILESKPVQCQSPSCNETKRSSCMWDCWECSSTWLPVCQPGLERFHFSSRTPRRCTFLVHELHICDSLTWLRLGSQPVELQSQALGPFDDVHDHEKAKLHVRSQLKTKLGDVLKGTSKNDATWLYGKERFSWHGRQYAMWLQLQSLHQSLAKASRSVIRWMKENLQQTWPYVEVYHPEWTSSKSLAEAVVRFDEKRYEKDALRPSPSCSEMSWTCYEMLPTAVFH